MRWFRESAPIRLKMLVSFGILWGLIVLVAVIPLLIGKAAIWVEVGVIVVAAIACIAFREAVAGPYVTTVVRMEALAPAIWILL